VWAVDVFVYVDVCVRAFKFLLDEMCLLYERKAREKQNYANIWYLIRITQAWQHFIVRLTYQIKYILNKRIYLVCNKFIFAFLTQQGNSWKEAYYPLWQKLYIACAMVFVCFSSIIFPNNSHCYLAALSCSISWINIDVWCVSGGHYINRSYIYTT